MYKLSCVFMLMTLLAACATAKRTYTADGQPGYDVNCSGTALNWGMCYEKAGDLCKKRGYKVLQKSGDEGASVAGTQYGVFGSSIINRSMIVQCNSAAPNR